MNVALKPSIQMPTSLQLSEQAIISYYHVPEISVPFAALLEPDYWAHVAKHLRPGHEIKVDAFDMSWTARLKVRWADRVSAKVGVIEMVEFEGQIDPREEADLPYKLQWRGPARRWGVVRKSDSEVVKDEFQSKEVAMQWLRNHLKSM